MNYAQRVQQLTSKLGAGAPDYSQRWQAPVAHVDGPASPTKPNFGGTGMDYFQKYKSGTYDFPKSSSGVHARGGGDVRRQVMASGGPRQMTLAEKEAYAEARGIKQVPYDGPSASSGRKGVTFTEPSWYSGAMSGSAWEANPVREYENGAAMYRNPANGYLYWVGPEGQRVEYQANHDRMFVEGQQTTSFPSWLPQEEQRMIKSQGLR